jgi:enoyl-CoA hydratase/carnithine racemase
MIDTPLKVEREGAIAILTLNAPERRNGIVPALIEAMLAAIADINADPGISCVILTGADPAFCAGGNLKGMYAREGVFGGSVEVRKRYYTEGIQRLTLAMTSIEVPIIAAVNGPAIGAGLDFVTMCPVRIASERATFAESFIKLGMVSGDGGAWLLPRAIGDAAAAEMTLTGDTVDAETARTLGIVSRVVPHGDLMQTAREIAARIVRHPPGAIRQNLKLLRDSRNLDLTEALDLASTMQANIQQTADHYEAVSAAVEKRPAVFTGA